MWINKVARRYAHAFHETAREAHAVETVAADFSALVSAIRESRLLQRFLADYSLPRQNRRHALETLFQDRLAPLTWKFVRFMESKRRLAELGETAAQFQEIQDAERGLILIRVVSAAPLGAGTVETLSRKLQDRHWGPVHIEASTDPGLLAGLRLYMGDRMTDYSLLGALQSLRARMSGAT